MKHFKIVILILLSIHFWGYVGINPALFKFTNVLALGIMGYSLINNVNNDNLRFKNAIFLFLIGILLNILSAQMNNGQSVRDTALTAINYYFIIFYFFLHDEDLKKKDFEVIIIVFAVLYSLFYLLQEAQYPTRLFAGNMFADRGTVRIRIEGSGFLVLAYLMLLNKFLLKRNFLQLGLALFFFFVLLKGGFRSLTAGAVLVSAILFFKLVKFSPSNYFMIVVAIILFLGMLQMDSTSRIVDNMISATEEQKSEGEDYIRRRQFDFYSKVYPKNFSYFIIGGGLPGGYGPYSNYMNSLVQQYGFYWVDLGLIGFYYVVGLVALLGILAYSIKAIFIKLPPEYFYLNMYFAFLLLVSITTAEIFRAGMLPVEAIALFLIDKGRNKYDRIVDKYGEFDEFEEYGEEHEEEYEEE